MVQLASQTILGAPCKTIPQPHGIIVSAKRPNPWILRSGSVQPRPVGLASALPAEDGTLPLRKTCDVRTSPSLTPELERMVNQAMQKLWLSLVFELVCRKSVGGKRHQCHLTWTRKTTYLPPSRQILPTVDASKWPIGSLTLARSI